MTTAGTGHRTWADLSWRGTASGHRIGPGRPAV